jgi:hypothetical protein
MKLGQGIHFDVPSAVYFSDPAPGPSLTQSIAKVLLDQSPGHAKLEHPRLTPRSPDDDGAEKYVAAQAIGNAAHKLMIGRGKDVTIVDADDWRTKVAKETRDKVIEAGRMPILAKHHVRVDAMVKAARVQLNDAGWKEAFRDGDGEVVLIWEEDGIWFRTMIDWMYDFNPFCCDYKTSAMSVAPHAIGRLAVDAGWDIQAAMHERGLNILRPEDAGRRRFRFAAQENYPPYALTPVEMSEHWLTMGRKKLQHAIDIWRRCMETDTWPLYPLAPIVPDYPSWQETQWLDREVAAQFQGIRGDLQTILDAG